MRSLHLLLFGLLLTPLCAQLDPRLRMATDILDGSQRGITGKPEVICLLDFSGSMSAMVRHSACKVSIGETDARVQMFSSDGDDLSLGKFTGRLTAGGASGTYTITVKAPKISAYMEPPPVIPLPTTPPAYPPLATGLLVAPDGNLLKPALNSSGGVLDFTPFRGTPVISGTNVTLLPNHQWWIRQSSHARLTAGRTVDLPIPWRIMGAPDNKAPNDAYVEDPPKSGKLIWYEYKGTSAAETDAYELIKVGVTPEGGKIAASRNTLLSPGTSNFSYESSYFNWIFTQPDFDASTRPGFKNGIPAISRAQAVKKVMIKTWVDVQSMLHFAYRYLTNTNEGSEEGLGTVNSDNESGGSRLRSLRYLKEGDPSAFIDLQKREPEGGTPLTSALANTYAQMMDGSLFNAAEGGEPVDLAECRKHYVIVFTDGEANDAGGVGAGDLFAGYKENGSWLSSVSGVDAGGSNFNIWTLAGMAAHGSQVQDPNVSTSQPWMRSSASGIASISSYLPFGVRQRGSVAFNPPHPIKTVTVGMSLGDNSNGKLALLRTAGYGNPKGYGLPGAQPSWDASAFRGAFETPAFGSQTVDFFDTQDAEQLQKALEKIFTSMCEETGSIAAPSSPSAGLRSGGITYLTTFKPAGGSPMWLGDLMMASLGTKGGVFTLFGKNGEPLDARQSNPVWSASKILKAMDWSQRKVYTFFDTKKLTSKNANRHAKLEVDLTSAKYAYATSNNDLLEFMSNGGAHGSKDQQKPKIEWMRGNRPKEDPNNLARMGDVINSSPVSLEYDASLFSGTGLGTTSASGERCRVIFVGTNHGFLHAFGEVSRPKKDEKGNISYYEAQATELWSFIPKDFLKGAAEQLASGAGGHVFTSDLLAEFSSTAAMEGGVHAFMVDGPVMGYLDEDKSTAGKAGVVDSSNEKRLDRALVVFGLGKGGRSFYALDVTNPVKPKLAWALIPDDETGDVVNGTIANMGLSTGLPALASITNNNDKKFQDLVFIGGGLSTDVIDGQFTAYSKKDIRLGRSVQALDVGTGDIYRSWDFVENSDLSTFKDIGSIPASPVPFDVLGSYTAQRVYFTDRSGGVYCLGSNKRMKEEGSNPGLRIDSSDPKRWTTDGTDTGALAVRKIWQAGEGQMITTSPFPFLVNFPGAPADKGLMVPSAVGIAVGSGDSWDPMDRDTYNPVGGTRGNYSVAVLFDRQDSARKGYDTGGISNLFELKAGRPGDAVDPGSPSYFLKSNDGFYIKLKDGVLKDSTARKDTVGGRSRFYYEKVLTEPFVQRGKGAGTFWTLWFNVFNPSVTFTPLWYNSEWLCGGGGQTTTFRIHNVLSPQWSRGFISSNDDHSSSGALFQFRGVAGRISATGPGTIVVPGPITLNRGVTPSGPSAGGISMGQDTIVQSGPPVVPKTWRIVR